MQDSQKSLILLHMIWRKVAFVLMLHSVGHLESDNLIKNPTFHFEVPSTIPYFPDISISGSALDHGTKNPEFPQRITQNS